MLLFFFTSLCNWFKKLTPLAQPIRFNTKTNHDLVARVFPRFRLFARFYFKFSLAHHYFPLLCLAVVIIWDLVIQYSNEKRYKIQW